MSDYSVGSKNESSEEEDSQDLTDQFQENEQEDQSTLNLELPELAHKRSKSIESIALQNQIGKKKKKTKKKKTGQKMPQERPKTTQHHSSEIQNSKPQPFKNAVNVFARFRPDNDKELLEGTNCIEFSNDETQVKIVTNQNAHTFHYQKVFQEDTTQKEIFDFCAGPLLDVVLQGYNCAVIAYGQTGAGKTHTILGPGWDNHQNIKKSKNPELRGIMPRFFQLIFDYIMNSTDFTLNYDIRASFIEIYNEKIKDLLFPNSLPLKLRQDAHAGLWVTDATQVPIKSINEVLTLIEQGIFNRKTAETQSNAQSSRSHAIFIITFQVHDTLRGITKQSQLYIVDLSGSERAVKTGAVQERMTEAQYINKSLLALGNVIQALSEKKKHVPYRDSKITRLLQNSLGGNSYTSIVLCCSSNSYNANETLSTLKFGDRANKVANKPIANQQISFEELKRQLEHSQAELKISRRKMKEREEENESLKQLIQELYWQLGDKKQNVIRQRYKRIMPNTEVFDPKQGINGLGYHTKGYVCFFLSPFEIGKLATTCTVWRNFLQKCEQVWKFLINNLTKGQVTIDGKIDKSLLKFYQEQKFLEEGVDIQKIQNLREYFYKKATDRYKAMKAAQIKSTPGNKYGLKLVQS